MAIALDSRLPSSSRSPLRSQRSSLAAPRVNDGAVQSLTNSLTGRSGAREETLQSATRAGISRGRGQRYMADVAGAMQQAQNQAEAGQAEMRAGQANADAQLRYDAMRSNERLASEGLLDGLRADQARERAANRASGIDLYDQHRRGQFALDSMQLDLTPLLRPLLS